MGLPRGAVSNILVKGWVDGPWGKIMTGQMALPRFARVFCQLLRQERFYQQTNREIPADTVVAFMSSYGDDQEYPEMLEAARCVRARGLRTALLTNNCFLDESMTQTLLPLDRSLFDVVVESCVLGYSKPHPRAFTECLRLVQVSPDQAVFLDDLTDNVFAARNLGITAIKGFLDDLCSCLVVGVPHSTSERSFHCTSIWYNIINSTTSKNHFHNILTVCLEQLGEEALPTYLRVTCDTRLTWKAQTDKCHHQSEYNVLRTGSKEACWNAMWSSYDSIKDSTYTLDVSAQS
ncbi:acyl-CoA dehydrogenase family, member 10 [Elysia marginata]|uniref:Acyl-CoA dehydrogenase family, member 10 n=1 Tax=Elysia marginata TaxID=1093978 RepID=A0AAV4G9T2_9GAST|nr:acyl-CoA dehydrogenase family, member 10 [Elysia marginata]